MGRLDVEGAWFVFRDALVDNRVSEWGVGKISWDRNGTTYCNEELNEDVKEKIKECVLWLNESESEIKNSNYSVSKKIGKGLGH